MRGGKPFGSSWKMCLGCDCGECVFPGACGTFCSSAKNPQRTKASTKLQIYDSPGTKLEGTLVERKVYGPPGYGETPARDAKETILVLKLSHPVTVEPAANAEANGSPNLEPVRNVPEVQLILSRSYTVNTRKLVGKRVTATGTLNESITASQRTKVWMFVQALSPK
jgi:hypothetical protein